MRFTFSRRTVAGGEAQRVKKIPLLSIFRLKTEKNHTKHAPTASSPLANALSKQPPSTSSSKVAIKCETPSPNPAHSPTQLNLQTPVVDFHEAYVYSRSPEGGHELEDTFEDACYARPSRCPGFYEEDLESEETPTFKTSNSSAISTVPSVDQLAPNEPTHISPLAVSFSKTSARPSQGMTFYMESIPEEVEAEDISAHDMLELECAVEDGEYARPSYCPGFYDEDCESEEVMTFFMESIPEEIEAEEISTHDTPWATPSSSLTHPSPNTATVLTGSICSFSPRLWCQPELSMPNFEGTSADCLPNDQQETVALCYEPKGLGLFLPSATTLSNGILQPYSQLESVADNQPARSLSSLAGSMTSSHDLPRPSSSSCASPLLSPTFDFSSPHKETASISPATSVDEQQRSEPSSSKSDISSKDCLRDLDKWSSELKTLQKRFQSHKSATPMEALLGALFPEEYPHFAQTSSSFASYSSSAHADILCESPAPTPSSEYLLLQPLASSPSMSDADSQDHWKSRVSMCDIRELARRENERLERFGPQHSTSEELRLLDITELSLDVPYRQ
ncbi:hypothetical protein FRB96_007719 [Tulasnella sp. 330]|nr:hypothetical protein FRB96_007719 [Tulasnella sp. 330]